ncbi:hypothetical protein FHS61_003121 [Altererythrobacter atlanticus]|uniref:Zeta toxin n=1 Tax=Croceibacterium atlanticum TaxID=1267766 RepID=A0A0F7KUX1_9SPHN|nr:bifunctional aminoglycoside phosphotransferase/ATP-binding protein [Croceibacterium atlanticum]AKH42971.1 Zeta toxin [Croceibacterium atlanticum]MBB5734072.1 hypothetical protein [Croceibacterium atlanticum]
MTAQQDQQEVIDFLSRPESHGGAGPVERVETHIAVIFLVGDRAFKLKRAVRYSYLDFSTPAQRRAVCEEELRLNRRTAPELYIAVRSIGRRQDGSLGFDVGDPIDWVVEMRRFDDGALLEAVAERGDLDPGLVRRLADGIAKFHESAEIIRVQDGAERIRSIVTGNRESMAAQPDVLAAEKCDALYRRSLEQVDRLAPLLDSRARNGFVRHCHGDLHLANICLWRGEPTLFDCLEFNSDLATTDVLYDAAFLVMDMWERGLRRQASLLFNRYCDMSGESEGVATLPPFLSMRAAIRAHVNASAAAQMDDAEKARGKRTQAGEYLAAALTFLDQPLPRLVVVGGFSGTGKSSLAGKLAPEIGGAPGARWLRTDVLRKRMAGVSPEESLSPDAYTQERSDKVYMRLMDEARAMLSAGRSVVVDGVFARYAERSRMEELARQAGVPFTGLWLEAPPEVLKQRVSGRVGDASDADAAVVDLQIARDPGDLSDWRRVDAAPAPDAVLAAARNHLRD